MRGVMLNPPAAPTSTARRGSRGNRGTARKPLHVDFDVIASVEDGDALVDAAERLSPE